MKIFELLAEAPTLGDPSALQKLAAMGQAPKKPTTGPNLLGGIKQGFQKGMGMDPSDSLLKGAALKGLQATGFNQTANSLSGSSQPVDNKQTDTDPNAPASATTSQQSVGTTGKLPMPGTIIKDPKYGNVKVMPTPAGQKGVKLDTTNILGFPVMVDPKDLVR
jgi:hypothetical protein